jgi:hypothetical protein
MQTNVTTEKGYSVSYFKPGQKEGYGFSVSATGDKKNKVLKDARELLEQAQATALEFYNKIPNPIDKGL